MRKLTKMVNPEIVARNLSLETYDKWQEEFWVLALDAKNRLIKAECIFKGTLTNVLVSPREVFYFAIMNHAAAIVIGHNHPSGDTTPSKDDDKMTKNVVSAGRIMGIPVLDHIIVGDGYYSYMENDKLQGVE